MGAAKVISMIAQPMHVSYLAFEIGGILDTRHAELGEAVTHMPFQKLCDPLKTEKTVPGDLSRLRFDSHEIMEFANKFSLATLRNEDRKAAVDTAVNSRQNVYFSKHANSASVISTINGYYSKASPASKPNRLGFLDDIAEEQYVNLYEAYEEDDRMGVVKATSSCIETKTKSKGHSLRAGQFYQESVGRNVGKGTKLPHVPPIPWPEHPNWGGIGYESVRFIAPATAATALTTGVNFEESNNSGRVSGTQSATHVDYEYRTPFLEARARLNRAHISIIDQKFESFMFEQNIPHLEQIFNNELSSVDNDVYQLQIALLRSFLISPVPGVVTGIYKHPGDAVNAGEPVIRVEYYEVVHLLANLVHQGPISIGATATVTTTLGGVSSPATTLAGSVVAARAQGDGGRWEVVVKFNNVNSGGNYILPLNYHFDPDYTVVSVV